MTGGFFLGKSILANAYNTSPVVSDEKHANGNYKYWGTSGPELGTGLKSYTVVSDKQGNINADAKVNSFKPYLGVGFGRAVPKGRIGFSFDLGVQFWGTPGVYAGVKDDFGNFHEKKLEKGDVKNDDTDKFFDTMSKIVVYPVLSFRLSGRFL